MKHYSVIPQDWDYAHGQEIKELGAKGCYTPCQVEEVVGHCGSLFPFVTTKSGAIAYVKNLKKQFPFIVFGLMEDKTWGEMELIQSF